MIRNVEYVNISKITSAGCTLALGSSVGGLEGEPDGLDVGLDVVGLVLGASVGFFDG